MARTRPRTCLSSTLLVQDSSRWSVESTTPSSSWVFLHRSATEASLTQTIKINGEKINPVPSELTIKVFPGVSEAIVFGAARSQAGVLIVLAESVDPSSSRAELLKIVTPALIAANKAAPTHAELMPEMVVFLPFGTLIPKADKASFIRAKVYAMFKSEIEAAYERLEGNDGVADDDRQAVGKVEEMQTHILALAGKVAGAKTAIGLETDLFTAGLDSLQAGRIRNSLQRVDRKSVV